MDTGSHDRGATAHGVTAHGVTPRETEAMLRALDLAARAAPHGPNPRVGCVLLAPDGRVLAEGHHTGAGAPHAEAEAVAAGKAAGVDLTGATAVVTLEPCSHTGRTPPCARALLEAGVSRVVVGAQDPNPVAAGGTAVLRAGGVDVVTGVLASESTSLNRYWTHAVTRGRPFVTLKWAATLDGRVAAADGTSRWLTGSAARADVHDRRACADAVLVGTGTALADDPWLTTRRTAADGRTELAAHQPLRVVLGERDLPAGARLRDDAAETLQLRTRDVEQALTELAAREVRHLWVEGGPTVAAAFLRSGAVDELVTYVAPAVLGAGAPAVGDVGVGTVDDTLRFRLSDVTRLGGDVVLVSTPEKEPV
ncbi:bifunctional diaminohydroxyphosphoribosylaminopyrimidine deaminase/5-amino-6-(5-phosphoribosylamino)uracil reductase RibD [Jannaschia sp. R86511]|uniref:bifunctional diaminohydroxyphosphoribosylaminopyrimidine deaminase/5-amino-6-(5-phosphoribosylamino)uracil reductase RibD n=1 Tax=Jannaschia sp. R86511 TaxID=3093853 RepID=UPI0036D2612D